MIAESGLGMMIYPLVGGFEHVLFSISKMACHPSH